MNPQWPVAPKTGSGGLYGSQSCTSDLCIATKSTPWAVANPCSCQAFSCGSCTNVRATSSLWSSLTIVPPTFSVIIRIFSSFGGRSNRVLFGYWVWQKAHEQSVAQGGLGADPNI